VRLVLDTNTALSGLLWDGAPGRLIQAAETGTIEIVSSVALLTELRDILSREKFARRLAPAGRQLCEGLYRLHRIGNDRGARSNLADDFAGPC
jgi:putative PIN family toxin of toxin-antitoxin system